MKTLLDECHHWPTSYTFKFVVPEDALSNLQTALEKEQENGDWSTRSSRTGKYRSITLTLEMSSAEAVVGIYRKASTVPGLIAF